MFHLKLFLLKFEVVSLAVVAASISSAGGLKCLYGFLDFSPLRGEISVSEPTRLII